MTFTNASRRTTTALFALLSALSACDLTPPPAHEQSATTKAPASTAAAQQAGPADTGPAAQAAGEQLEQLEKIEPGELHEHADRFPAPPRLIAIGDVHGDLAATKRALRLAGAIDASDKWIGGELVIVQTGDQLDRGDGEQEILELFARIQHEASEAGGAIHILNGNHEFMNALGDLRYVTPGGLTDFEDAPGVDPDAPALAPLMEQVPEAAQARVAAFWPGQPWARELAKRNVVVVVGDSVFVHGGVTPVWADKLKTINSEAREWLSGARPEPPKAITDPEGPVWSRHYSQDPDASDCAMLSEALATIGAERMIVGHTVHKEGIGSACDGKVWTIDVGMAAHYGGPTQVLEIRGDELKVLEG